MLKSSRREAESALAAGIRRKLSATGIAVQNKARERCPVDTGRLRNSITHEVQRGRVVIGTNVEYAPFIELGTSRSPARPFLATGLMDARGDISRIWSSP